MECPICFDTISNSCVGSCMHHYCYSCLIKWISYRCECPKCKKPIFEIKLDKEFDSINNPDCSILIEEITRKIEINFEDDTPPGITIINNPNGPGIKIKSLILKEKCYLSGLRNGDVILFLNSVPCVNHSISIEIIKNAFKNKKQLICELLIVKK